jgi:signal transduction histidine kinase
VALHGVSSTVKSVKELGTVIKRILAGVLEGLGLEMVILVHFDRERKYARVHTLGDEQRLREIGTAIGDGLEDLRFRIDNAKSPALLEIMNQRLIFRRNLFEIVEGLDGLPDKDRCDAIQRVMGIKRIIAVPLVVEDVSLGALVGFSKEPFMESEQVATLESFANHAAISLEAASLIDALRRVNLQLEDANRVKSEFLATMSHELRTPLTAIIGFSELMIEGVTGEINEEQKESLEEVLRNSSELLDLINSLLDLTKIESGRMSLDISEYNLASTINRVVGMIFPLAHKKHQGLSVDVAGDVPTILGDEKKIQQVILNLIANANKFTPDGGNISVSARFFREISEIRKKFENPKALDDLYVTSNDGWFAMEVSDNGIGIPFEHQERIFEMFHQADSSVTRSFGGTGLGLSLAKKLVELHGGRIWVHSNLGCGAAFRMALPVTSQKMSGS